MGLRAGPLESMTYSKYGAGGEWFGYHGRHTEYVDTERIKTTKVAVIEKKREEAMLNGRYCAFDLKENVFI